MQTAADSPALRRFLWIDNGLLAGVVNVVINAALAWVSYRGLPILPIWGWEQSVAGDLLGTCYLLPAITVLIATPLCKRRDDLAAVPCPAGLRAVSSRWLIVRSVQWGVAGFLLLGPCVCGVLVLLDDSVTTRWFVISKLAFVFALGMVVTPPIARLALADREVSQSTGPDESR